MLYYTGRESISECDACQTPEGPSPFGGPGGLSGERPPVEMSDSELDARAERQYAERQAHFEALASFTIRKKRRRYLHEYTAKNCEEAYGGRS